MTRIYIVSYAEHLAFQPDPVPQPTKRNPDGVIVQPPVDTWRACSKTVAVIDGWAEDAIKKVKEIVKQSEDVQEGRVKEVKIVAVALQNEAE